MVNAYPLCRCASEKNLPHSIMAQLGSLTEDAMMSPLGQRVIVVMQMHRFSSRTHESYLAAVRGLVEYTQDVLVP